MRRSKSLIKLPDLGDIGPDMVLLENLAACPTGFQGDDDKGNRRGEHSYHITENKGLPVSSQHVNTRNHQKRVSVFLHCSFSGLQFTIQTLEIKSETEIKKDNSKFPGGNSIIRKWKVLKLTKPKNCVPAESEPIGRW